MPSRKEPMPKAVSLCAGKDDMYFLCEDGSVWRERTTWSSTHPRVPIKRIVHRVVKPGLLVTPKDSQS